MIHLTSKMKGKAANNKGKSFLAVEVEETLYPLEDETDKKTTFISGIGHIKLMKKNVHPVPHIDMENITNEIWNNYLKEYGKHCLFYSLTSEFLKDKILTDMDNVRDEFNCIVKKEIPIERYNEYCKLFKAFNTLQIVKLMRSNIAPIWYDELLFYPRFTVDSIFYTYPYMDTLRDDVQLCTFYCLDKLKNYEKEYSLEEQALLRRKYFNGNADFWLPATMKDRLISSYGEEAFELYKQLVEFFD